MRFRVQGVSSGVVVLATLVLLGATVPNALADKGRGGRGGGHHGGGHGRGGFHIGLGPGGLSYGYHSRGFSIDVVPSSYGYYPAYGYSTFSSPTYYPTPDYYAPSNYGYTSQPLGYPESASPDYGYSVVDDGQRPYAVPNRGAPTELPPPAPVAPTPTLEYRPVAVTSTVVPTNQRAAAFQHRAEHAFRNGQYDAAQRMVNHAIVEDGTNGKLLLFQSQVQFAIGDYVGAVASLEQAMALVPPGDRGFVVQRYRRLYQGRAYVEQMDRLVQYFKAHPQADYALALRAYHHLHLGHERAAQDLLQQAAALHGDTQMAGGLIATLWSELDVPQLPTPQPASDVRPTSSSGSE